MSVSRKDMRKSKATRKFEWDRELPRTTKRELMVLAAKQVEHHRATLLQTIADTDRIMGIADTSPLHNLKPGYCRFAPPWENGLTVNNARCKGCREEKRLLEIAQVTERITGEDKHPEQFLKEG